MQYAKSTKARTGPCQQRKECNELNSRILVCKKALHDNLFKSRKVGSINKKNLLHNLCTMIFPSTQEHANATSYPYTSRHHLPTPSSPAPSALLSPLSPHQPHVPALITLQQNLLVFPLIFGSCQPCTPVQSCIAEKPTGTSTQALRDFPLHHPPCDILMTTPGACNPPSTQWACYIVGLFLGRIGKDGIKDGDTDGVYGIMDAIV